ncbi:MAG: hypothetical protein ABI947_12265 [Chloroflexota bacterium]
MSKITYAWINPEKTILLCTYPEPGWSWADLSVAFKQQQNLIEGVGHPVYVVVDVHKSNWMPSGGSLLSMMRNFKFTRHPNQKDTIIASARGFLVNVVSSLMRLRNESLRDFHLVSTLDEAYALIDRLEDFRTRRVG